MIGYVRVSTLEQADSGAGLEAQRLTIRCEATRRGWELVTIEKDMLSGRDLHRPGLARALAACRSGDVAGIVVAKLDRLSRSLIDFTRLLAEARAGGWNLVALDLGLDLSTTNGKLVANVMASVSEWERDVIGDRTRDALAVRRAEGVRLGRPPLLPEDVARRVRRLRRRGLTFQRIAALLNGEGMPAPAGGRWDRAAVRRVVNRAPQDVSSFD